MPQLDTGTTNRAELLKQWRQALGYTQKDLAAILGVSNFHICEQERHREPTTARTINHLALVYAIHSLPPEVLEDPSEGVDTTLHATDTMLGSVLTIFNQATKN